MSDAVHLSLADDIAVITIDNPPVNVASRAVRAGLMMALDRAEAAGVARVVLTGAGKTFVAGADAKEFSAPPRPPHLPDIANRIESFPVPVVAAINGAALGGGLELALACAARVAAPRATLGLPEVTLGVVPGAGGTQRLPRLVGLEQALSLIPEGRVIGAAEARRIGLADTVAEDPVAAARTLALPERPATGALPAPPMQPEAIQAALKSAAKRSPRQIAPLRAIDLIEASTRLPLSEGLALERETFLDLKTGDQAAALRHVFFAERAAMAQGRADGTEIRSALVVGGGTMGAGIAYALAQAGVTVALVETDTAAVERARANVARLYAEAVARGKSSFEAAEAAQAARHFFHAGYDGLPQVDIAIEAVFEDLEVKRQVFAALDAALPDTAILATNTSYLDPDRIAEGLRNPGRFLGLHFFSPAHVMKLVEVIRAGKTSPQTLATALRLAARLKKIPVLAGVCDGFIGNRILTRYRQTCDVMLIEGALPAQVDQAMRGFGMAMGPYEVQDLSGLDIAHANRKRLGWRTKPGFRYIPIADRIVEETGRLGRKTGAGWYDHDGGKASPSPLIDAIVAEESARAGIARRDFADDEIVARATAAMVEEGFRILSEGIATRSADIDLVLVHGYGFPRWRGGPMHWAGRTGLTEILRRIEGYAAEDPLSWAVPALLARAVADGKTPEEL
ncbi:MULTISPECIES: 3-hydroxyacyl-CoA dehydrogenase NAD-binding domain-containing protein [Paracoccus]|uniref:3-hydroxyacyl-CoA dehydrogenase NAD-binding domain-containing protein n=1 Tax=Paracoccus TaxID=265 RepID=UPI000DF82222|nr:MULTISPECIES: 3-hydroxyacyl-CoA dehydrogenase NAD-binding domain-containing protein [Paracoccus]MBT0779298.1 enoyl-CoA hydratase/isomerase family protein [Paracoccus sp. pheM1]RDD70060.1 enoyl-CoA hydratase [Paracoccus versutus]